MINIFLKLKTFDLSAVSIVQDIVTVRIFIQHAAQFILADLEILSSFFNCQGILLPYWNLILCHIAPLCCGPPPGAAALFLIKYVSNS